MSRPAPHKRVQDQRVVKLLLPLPLIRSMDRLLVEGVGGFTTRNEVVREAIESYLLELTHEPAPAEPAVRSRRARGRLAVAPTRLDPDQPELLDAEAEDTVPFSVLTTALAQLPADVPVIAGVAGVVDEPLFGMHNRDYPSLWVARRLVDYVGQGPLVFEEFAERVTDEAWSFAELLSSLEGEGAQKLTALFPTNHAKRPTASSAFRVFAIGNVTANGRVRAEGALFLWRVIDVSPSEGGFVVGLTEPGRVLLEQLAGLTVVPPHPPEHARAFVAHLRVHASADWWGFEQVLAIVTERPTRLELVEAFRAARPDWRETVAATNAQGYVARAREWGLIAPKVIDGRYELTELGAEVAEGGAE
jgi:hypothetical protein